jgi:CDP-diacylglycerol--glycerol-3-phosphate 3-phosphatidyltransferase/cardiolipin synthase
MDPEHANAGGFHARDLLRVPSLLSLVRVPLAALFPFAPTPALAFVVLVVSGLTDVVDGWYARRFGQVTATGAVVDPITDKLFVATVVVTLIVRAKLSWFTLALLGTREIGELPLVAWLALSTRARRARTEQPSANVPGKLATALQFGTVSATLLGWAYVEAWAWATAVMGTIAAIAYWRRFLRAAR